MNIFRFNYSYNLADVDILVLNSLDYEIHSVAKLLFYPGYYQKILSGKFYYSPLFLSARQEKRNFLYRSIVLSMFT